MIHLFYISIIVMILVIHLCSRKSKCKKLVWASIGEWISIDTKTVCNVAYYEIWKQNGRYSLKLGGHRPKENLMYPVAVEKLNEFNSKSHKND